MEVDLWLMLQDRWKTPRFVYNNTSHKVLKNMLLALLLYLPCNPKTLDQVDEGKHIIIKSA